jgi:hypothetical protein
MITPDQILTIILEQLLLTTVDIHTDKLLQKITNEIERRPKHVFYFQRFLVGIQLQLACKLYDHHMRASGELSVKPSIKKPAQIVNDYRRTQEQKSIEQYGYCEKDQLVNHQLDMEFARLYNVNCYKAIYQHIQQLEKPISTANQILLCLHYYRDHGRNRSLYFSLTLDEIAKNLQGLDYFNQYPVKLTQPEQLIKSRALIPCIINAQPYDGIECTVQFERSSSVHQSTDRVSRSRFFHTSETSYTPAELEAELIATFNRLPNTLNLRPRSTAIVDGLEGPDFSSEAADGTTFCDSIMIRLDCMAANNPDINSLDSARTISPYASIL